MRRCVALLLASLALPSCGPAVTPAEEHATRRTVPTAERARDTGGVSEDTPSRTVDPVEPPRPYPPVATPLALAPEPGPLPPFGTRLEPPHPVLFEGWREASLVVPRSPTPAPPVDLTTQAVQRWAQTGFARWLTARRDRVMAAESALLRVSRLPEAGGDVGVAAALVGWLYDRFMHDFAAITPIPENIAQDDELLGIYGDAIWSGTATLVRRAREAYTMCVRYLESESRGWALAYRGYCAERADLLERAPSSVPAEELRRRLAAWSPPAPPAAVTTRGPTIAPLSPPRPLRAPARSRAQGQALDSLLRGLYTLAAGQDPTEAWRPFLSATTAEEMERWPLAMREHVQDLGVVLGNAPPEPRTVGVLGMLRAPAGSVGSATTGSGIGYGGIGLAPTPRQAVPPPPTDEPIDFLEERTSVLAQLSDGLEGLLEVSSTTDPARDGCWAGRAAAIGILIRAHRGVMEEHTAAARQASRELARVEARRREQLELARSMATLQGDALSRAGWLVQVDDGELPSAQLAALSEALAQYSQASTEDGPELQAVRRAASALSTAHAPAFEPELDPSPATLATEAQRIGALYSAFARSASAGARAVSRFDPEQRTRVELDSLPWTRFAETCR